MKKGMVSFIAVFLFSFGSSQAKSNFEIDIVADNGAYVYHGEYVTSEELFAGFKGSSLERTIPNYNENMSLSVTLDFRGVNMFLDYPADSTTLRFRIPDTGLDISFNETSREDAESRLSEWFKKDGGSEVTKLYQILAKQSPNDPIAGNPNSLMGNMVSQDFNDSVGFDTMGAADTPGSTAEASQSASEEDRGVSTQEQGSAKAQNQVGLGASYASIKIDEQENSKFTVPLSYTYVSKTNSRRKYTYKLPISRSEIGEAIGYSIGLGCMVNLPVNEVWIVTPSVNYGIGASPDMGTAASMASTSLSSAYTFMVQEYNFLLGNMVGYYKTLKTTVGDISIDPGIANTVLRTGLIGEISIEHILQDSFLQAFVVDTRYFGTELYLNQYNEIGITFKQAKYLSVGLTLLYASKATGFGANFGITF